MRKRKTLVALLALCGLFGIACLDTGASPDGVETPGEWDAYPAAAGTTIPFFGQIDEVGGRWVFEIDWGSPDNHVTFVVYDATGSCSVPTEVPDESSSPTCPVSAGDTTRAKPKRVEWVSQPGSTHVLTATNNGPGDETVMLREIRVE